METTDPAASTILSSLAPSTFAPFSLASGVTLEAIIAQLQCMDARLDSLTDEMCQVNTRVGRIAHRQAHLGGFSPSSSPFPKASADEDDDASDAEDDDAALLVMTR